MQLADLMKLFREGQNEGRKRGYVTQGACAAEGVTAIVRALRDEICHGYAENSARDLANAFNEILGDAGAEMPDLPTRTVQLTGITKSQRPDIQFEPATDPAPDVCEWTFVHRLEADEWTDYRLYRQSCDKEEYATRSALQFCPSCGKRIKFTEAK